MGKFFKLGYAGTVVGMAMLGGAVLHDYCRQHPESSVTKFFKEQSESHSDNGLVKYLGDLDKNTNVRIGATFIPYGKVQYTVWGTMAISLGLMGYDTRKKKDSFS